MIPMLVWAGAALLGYVVVEKVVKKEAHPFTSATSPVGRVRSKARTLIAQSQNPAQLRALAAGVVRVDPKAAVAAQQKAALIETQQAPFAQSLSSVTLAAPAAPSTHTYKVASGDYPSMIAARFGVTLRALAQANPGHAAQITAGKIFPGELLVLPASATDGGTSRHASGMVG